MARDVTVTFDDGSSHVYKGAPDNVTPAQIQARAEKETGKKVSAIDGGRKPAPAQEPSSGYSLLHPSTWSLDSNPVSNFGQYALNQVANAPASASHFVGGVVQAATHPVQTLEGIADVGAGELRKALPKPVNRAMDRVDWNPAGTKRAEDAATAFNQMLAERYGSPSKAVNTFRTDPVGSAADLSVIAGGLNALADRVAPKAAADVSEVAPRVTPPPPPDPVVTTGTQRIEAGQRRSVPVRPPEYRPDLQPRAGELARNENAKPIFDAAQQEDTDAIQAAINRDVAGGRPGLERGPLGNRLIDAKANQESAYSTVTDKIYKRVNALAPDFSAPADQSLKVVDDQVGAFSNKGLSDEADILQGLGDHLAAKGLSVDSVQGLRQMARNELGKRNLNPTALDRSVGIIQRQASAELTNALNKSGNEAAANLLSKANDMVRAQHDLRDDIYSKLFGPNPAVPKSGEQVADTLASWAQNDFGRLQKYVSILPKTDRADFAATTAHSLGQQPGGRFSLQTFMNSVSGGPGLKPKVSPEAQRLLFGNDGLRAINDLKTIVKGKQEALAGGMAGGPTQGAVSKLRRGLRTGLVTLMGGYLGSAVGGMEGALVGAGGAAAANRFMSKLGDVRAARMLTNPDYTKWLKSVPESNTPQAINAQFAKLRRVASLSRNKVFIADVAAYEAALRGTFTNDNILAQSPGRAAAQDEPDTGPVPPNQ